MDTPNQPTQNPEDMTEEQVLEAMFSNLVIQQTRTALFTLGQIPDPNSGQRILDLDTAQMLIATLEMLKAKTEGNLSQKEEELINKSIDQLHDIFQHTIEAIEKAHAEKGGQTEAGLFTPPSGIATPPGTQSASTINPLEGLQETVSSLSSAPEVNGGESLQKEPEAKLVSQESAPLEQPDKKEEEESRKRFSKKY